MLKHSQQTELCLSFIRKITSDTARLGGKAFKKEFAQWNYDRDAVIKAKCSRIAQASDLLGSSRRFALEVMGGEDIWILYKTPWDSNRLARRNRPHPPHPDRDCENIIQQISGEWRGIWGVHAWKSDTDASLLASVTPRYGNRRITVFKRLFAGSATKINLSVVSTCFWTRRLSDQTDGMVSLRCHRSRYIWATLGVLALLWLYIFPVYRIPSDKEMVDEVLRQGQTWSRNQTGVDLYRYFHSFNITFMHSFYSIIYDGQGHLSVMEF